MGKNQEEIPGDVHLLYATNPWGKSSWPAQDKFEVTESMSTKTLMSCRADEQEYHFHLKDGRRVGVSAIVDAATRILDMDLQPKLVEEAFVPGKTMNFCKALEHLMRGMRLYRQGWNGKGQYVLKIQESKEHHPQTGDVITRDPYFVLKNAQGTVSVWVPSTGDLLANDWCIKIISDHQPK